ncbi:MAG TPA: hypothetical protein VGN43_05555 [Steroidobacteraceae bacterium]|nr:hypothetical protein [Steroidobacteraceae bacterium]
MSDSSDLPEDVRRLLHEHIESYEQLEVLLLLRRERYEAWTPDTLAVRLRLGEALVAGALATLKSAGLISADADSDSAGRSPRYVYRPASSGLDATVGILDREYAERPISVIKLMSANSIERVRTAALHTFADAFVLNKKDKDRG